MCINPIKINGQCFPCGKCVECSKAYQNSLAIRCTEECKDWKHVYMITLTYDNEHLPVKRVKPYMVRHSLSDGVVLTTYFSSEDEARRYVNKHDIVLDCPIINVFQEVKDYLEKINNPHANAPYQDLEKLSGTKAIKFPTQEKGHFQRFMNSLRKNLERQGNGEKVKYLFSSEYGDNTWRPHYHAILFSNLPFERVKPLVDRYWKMGFIDCHEVTDDYRGSYLDKQAAFMYASKYIVKPQFLLNPLERFGVVDPCFRAWSKGLGKTYRKKFKVKADEIIDKISSKCIDDMNMIVCDDKYGHNKSIAIPYEIDGPGKFDPTVLFNREIYSINGIPVSYLNELVDACKYDTIMNKKLLRYSLPRYFREVIKPKIKIKKEEINYETGEVYEKILERVDAGCCWYNVFKMWIQLLHIQRVYRSLRETGEIGPMDSYSACLFKVRLALSCVDDDRISEAYRKVYKNYTPRG